MGEIVFIIHRYVISCTLCWHPPKLHRKYGGCATSFDVLHILSYINGGFVIARHKKVHDKLLYLA